MIVETALSVVITSGFAVIGLFEYFAQDRDRTSASSGTQLNRPIAILLGSCLVFGNLIIWIPVVFGW